MKTAEEILRDTEFYRGNPHIFHYSKTLEAMEKYAAQFKTKPCPCIQQEIDIENIAEKGVSNNNLN